MKIMIASLVLEMERNLILEVQIKNKIEVDMFNDYADKDKHVQWLCRYREKLEDEKIEDTNRQSYRAKLNKLGNNDKEAFMFTGMQFGM